MTPEQIPLPSLVPERPIATGRLLLRPMTRDDIPAIVRYRRKPDVYRYLSHGDLQVSQLEARMRLRIARMSMTGNESSVMFAIERLDRPGTVIGDCGLRAKSVWAKDGESTEHASASAVCTLDSAHAGEGIATEATSAIVDHAFSFPRIHRVTAEVFAPNTASRRVLEKLGFRCEGYFVDDAFFGGEFVDCCFYAQLRREWNQRA